MKFVIEESDEVLTAHSGLALIDLLLAKTRLGERLNRTAVPGRPNPSVSNRDTVWSYLGLLAQGKSDFDHIEPFREDLFFRVALSLKAVPSSPTLRQRLDLVAGRAGWEETLADESARLLRKVSAPLEPIRLEPDNSRLYIPLDVDVAPFDNSGTKKEGVSRTYHGYDGYAPIFAYLGHEGYAIRGELRPGTAHSQKGTPSFLERSLRHAQRVTDERILLRMDSGNDSYDNILVCRNPDTPADFIIKRNLRRESHQAWLAIAEQHGKRSDPRPGKELYRGSLMVRPRKLAEPVRMVFEVIKRTITAKGQVLLLPDIEVQAWWTSLPDEPEVIIGLYHDHGTMEQFHSELKTDLDLERLPSGKLATNNLVLQLALFAYNLLRIIGQESLRRPDVPLRSVRQRRRLRTVIQNFITLAARLTDHARQWHLRLGVGNRWLPAFRRLYQAFG